LEKYFCGAAESIRKMIESNPAAGVGLWAGDGASGNQAGND